MASLCLRCQEPQVPLSQCCCRVRSIPPQPCDVQILSLQRCRRNPGGNGPGVSLLLLLLCLSSSPLLTALECSFQGLGGAGCAQPQPLARLWLFPLHQVVPACSGASPESQLWGVGLSFPWLCWAPGPGRLWIRLCPG